MLKNTSVQSKATASIPTGWSNIISQLVNNGRIYMVPTAKPREHDYIWLSFPSIGLSPHQTRILLTKKQSEDSLNLGIDKRDIKMELYEKWIGEN